MMVGMGDECDGGLSGGMSVMVGRMGGMSVMVGGVGG